MSPEYPTPTPALPMPATPMAGPWPDGPEIMDSPAQEGESTAPAPETSPAPRMLVAPRRGPKPKGKRLVAAAEAKRVHLTPEQRLLILDSWQRSGLPAGDFAPLVNVSKHTLYLWKKRFEQDGPGALMDHPRQSGGSRLSEVVKRSILMMKKDNPAWGVERISQMLARGPGLSASPGAISRVLHEAGYVTQEVATNPHPQPPHRFERAKPNQMWQSDLFTFVLKRQNQRVYLVAFLDDHSRFVVSYGLHASQSAVMVLETFRAGITSYGAPEEMLTDNGTQYVTWRGTSMFAAECQKRGIKHIVATPRHPQTLGKTERFWGTLWREWMETAVFADIGDARLRIGHFIDHYNFQRPHQGIDGLVPADRFFHAAPAVRKAIQERVAANALEIARGGAPKAPFYLAGNVAGQAITLHAEGERMILTKDGARAEITLSPPGPATPIPRPAGPTGVVDSQWHGAPTIPPPGVSAIDAILPPGHPTNNLSTPQGA